MSLLLLLLHYWFRLLLLFPWKQILGKRKQGKGLKILTLKSAVSSVSVGSCSVEQEWKYLAKHHRMVTWISLLQHGYQRDLGCVLLLCLFIPFQTTTALLKREKEKCMGKQPKPTSECKIFLSDSAALWSTQWPLWKNCPQALGGASFWHTELNNSIVSFPEAAEQSQKPPKLIRL